MGGLCSLPREFAGAAGWRWLCGAGVVGVVAGRVVAGGGWWSDSGGAVDLLWWCWLAADGGLIGVVAVVVVRVRSVSGGGVAWFVF